MSIRHGNHILGPYQTGTMPIIPPTVAEHLLSCQGVINRLAAEQDVQLMELEADVQQLKVEIEGLQERLLQVEGRRHRAIVVSAAAVVFFSITKR